MAEPQSPHQKLLLLLDKIGIREEETDQLEPFKDLFVSKKTAFADYFYDFFYDMPDTRAILEGERAPGLMKQVWSSWFESFFRSKPNDDFLAYLWRVGVRHVEVSLDQRFSNLGFAMIRQFCHNVALTDVPPDQRIAALSTINKMLDFCLLAETTAYIENTISCDIEVMREVADRVRNPAMVIGWNIRKLQGKVDKGTKEHDVYEMLMGENRRLENMVKDIKVYMDIFQGEPKSRTVAIGMLWDSVLERLDGRGRYAHVSVDTSFHENARLLKGDPEWLEHLFYYLVQNSLEAAGEENAQIRIASQAEDIPPFNTRIEIFNSGSPPTEETEKLFTPFFSTKVTGTGFGLPIARLVARKHHGSLSIQGAAGEGTKVIISLPSPG